MSKIPTGVLQHRTVGIMQPYFMPYLGYFQLIHASDYFVIYDDVKYTKKGWVNRNYIIVNGVKSLITIPLNRDSDYLKINERTIAQTFDAKSLFKKIEQAYKKSPNWHQYQDHVEYIIFYPKRNLFDYLYNSIKTINLILGIKTPIYFSSQLKISEALKKQEKIFSVCKMFGATKYINLIGGEKLYGKEDFMNMGIHLSFLKSNSRIYPQASNSFIQHISILDTIMNQDPDETKEMIKEDLIWT